MRLFFTDAAFQRAIAAELVLRADAAFADRLDRFSNSPTLLRKAVAAQHGLSDWEFIDPDSFLLKPMAAAIRCFARNLP